MNDLKAIDRSNIRYCMKRLRNNEVLYLHGNRISFIGGDKFRIETTYQGVDEIGDRSAAWVRRYLKNDYKTEQVYSTNYDGTL